MRYKSAYILLAISLFIMASCEKEPALSASHGKSVVFNLDAGGMTLITKGTRIGEDILNENKLGSTVDLFFFRRNGDNEVLRAKKLGVQVQPGGRVVVETSDAEIKSIFGGLTDGMEGFVFAITNYSLSADLPADIGTTTLGELKNTKLQTNPWKEANSAEDYTREDSFIMTGEADMELKWDNQTAAKIEEIHMERLASKITFRISIMDEVKDEAGNLWYPQTTSGTRANLLYVLNSAKLSGEPQPVPGDPNSLDIKTYNTYRTITALSGTTVTQKRKNLETGIVEDKDVQVYYIPGTFTGTSGNTTCEWGFYTYPLSIEPGTSTEPYIKLIIPWKHDSNTREFYYKIPFQHLQLLRNTWYQILIDVQILGGDDDSKAPTLELKYSISDWSGQPAESSSNPNGSVLPGEIIAARYLNVSTKEFVLYNEDDLTIPIDSSHDIEIVGFNVKASGTAYTDKTLSNGSKNPASYIGVDPSIYNPFLSGTSNLLTGPDDITQSWVGNVNIVKPNFKTNADGTPAPDVTLIDTPAERSEMFPQVSRKIIKFHHTLKRNMNAGAGGYDIAPYTVRFRVRHQDDPTGYYSDIIIEQRPSMLIEPQRNSDKGDIDENGLTANNGYAFVNGTRTDANTSGRNNKNFNMYIIETSVLPSSGVLADYVLGDPRSKNSISSFSGASESPISARPIEYDFTNQGNQRGLVNYKAANDDEVYNDYIAPKFRIASSFGASSPKTRANAVLHCATYQEDGYPAGRWRLPTVAEIVYMARLTTDKLIPRLLGSDTPGDVTDYWANKNYVRITDGADAITPPVYYPDANVTTAYVRCVYDEWYWENSEHPRIKGGQYAQFRWGD